MIQLTQSKWLLILGIAVLVLLGATGISTYKLIEESERADALENALEIQEKDFKEFEQRTQAKIDSLQTLKEDREEQIDLRDIQIEEILANIENILNSTPNEEAIDNIRDADSLYDLFARFYPDNPRTGQGSD